jgi:hypothetical protein
MAALRGCRPLGYRARTARRMAGVQPSTGDAGLFVRHARAGVKLTIVYAGSIMSVALTGRAHVSQNTI